MNIGICAPYDLSRDGGVNSHVRAQARALRDLGHSVSVFGAASRPLGGHEIGVSGCVTLVVGGTETALGLDPRAWFRTGRLIARAGFDLLHVHEPLMPLVPWCAVLRSTVPLVGTFHAFREQGHRLYPRAKPLLAPIMRRLAARVVVSESARQTIAATFAGDYVVVPNGIDRQRFSAAAARPDALTPGELHVLYVGRLEPRKGVEHLVDAMQRVRARGIRARLVVAGDGPGRDALALRVRGAGVDARFVGRVSDQELPAYYQHADVVCSPAVGGESFGLVLVEAMAAGRPVVATSIDGYRDLAGEVARLVPPADPDALAGALAQLLCDGDLRRDLGARGRSFASAYDWPVVARRLEAIYYDVLSR